MSFSIHPELGRIAMRQGLELPFVVWSILRDSARLENLSTHYTKKEAVAIAAKNGLKFTARHWGRIWQRGTKIFWGTDKNHVFLRSFKRVALRFEEFTNDKDFSSTASDLFIQIQLSDGIESLRAELYYAWFLLHGEKTISRATLSDLFGISPDQQRSYEKLLGNRILVKTNYAHINTDSYKESPRELPEYHFTIKYEREVAFDEDVDCISAIQYQLPNTFIACHDNKGASPVRYGSNRARKAMRELCRHTDSLQPKKRTYWLKWSQFEALGSLTSLVRVYFQGKKRLWLTGHYL